MSAFVASRAYEPELNNLVREYLEVGGYDLTSANFDRECAEKGKSVPTAQGGRRGSSANANAQLQRELLATFQEGKRETFFALWESNLPEKLRNEDQVSQKLEFYLYLYFAIFPIKYGIEDTEDENMSAFRYYLETRGAQLSQTTEFLPYYALPYVPQPSAHPSFKELFSEHWVPDLQMRLERFLSLALDRPRVSRLHELYHQSAAMGKGDAADAKTVRALQTQVVEAEKRTMHYMKRHNRVQTDYHNLIGITAELVDSMENTLRGTPLSVEYLQQICKRLFATQRVAASSSDVVTRPGTAAQALRQSIMPSRQNTPRSQPRSQKSASQIPPPVPIDFDRTKVTLQNSPALKKGYLLQALRWRLTQSTPEVRDMQLTSYISGDLLGCATASSHRDAVLGALQEPADSVSAEYTARLFNTVASLCRGRGYISSDPAVLQCLVSVLKSQNQESATRENLIGCLQKLSLRRTMQSHMIEQGLVEWLVDILGDHDSLSDYTLEYSVALLMNLCLRSSGKRRCAQDSQKVLRTLSDLLGHENPEILPYVNGALYSILALPEVRRTANSMDMEGILKCFIKDDQPDMNRQIEFIIRQLNSHDEPDNAESDDEDDDDEEEADSLEPDLDKDEVLPAVPEQGEVLLKSEYSREKSAATQRLAAGQDLLTRPVTPGHRRATSDLQVAPDNTASRPGTGADPQKTDRPPTRSGSRPATGGSGAAAANTGEDEQERGVFEAKPRLNRTPDRNAPRPTYSQQLPTSRPNTSEKPATASARPSSRQKTPR